MNKEFIFRLRIAKKRKEMCVIISKYTKKYTDEKIIMYITLERNMIKGLRSET